MSLKQTIKNILSFFKYYLPLKKGASILMYHSVDNNDVFFTVQPKIFAKQMKFLRDKNYQIIKLADLIRMISSGKKIPKKTIVLTFDDGYEDNYHNVFPILKKYNFPVTIFIAPKRIGRSLANSQGSALKILNWYQMIEMEQSGLVDFQPHGLTHQKLNKLSQEEMNYEIAESKRILENRLNKKCDIFCYPRGRYNQGVIQILKKADFKAALTINKGYVKNDSDLFALKRNSINSTVSFVQFKAKL